MLHKTIKVFLFFAVMLLLACCVYEDVPDFEDGEYKGYKPVYASASEAAIILQSPRTLRNPGKIYVYGKYLLVNEKQRGIHFYDNTDPENPVVLGFLRVYGNVDMAVKDDILYVDHIGQLVALDITDLNNIQELSRHTFSGDQYPEQTGSYFECPDPSKGAVIGWELATLKNPKCYR